MSESGPDPSAPAGRRPTPKPRLARADIPRAAQIFANRNLKMSTVKLIGFDMDHTLAIYRPETFERLAFDAAKRKLVRSKGYSKRVLDLVYEHDFVIRGLVVDRRLGNVLKMDRHHYVTRVSHGRKRLDTAARKELYKGRKIPLSAPDYASVDTLFSLPEVSLYAQLVEIADADANGGSVDYRLLYDDVRECVDAVHRDGSIKSIIQDDPECYVTPDENLALTFDKFRRHGKKLFLLTNSELSFTEVVMSMLLEGRHPRYESWRDYFDMIIVDADKPSFFVAGAPLVHADGDHVGRPARPADKEKVYAGGNADAFEARIGFRGDQILYFGDHTYGDILRSKSTSGWRTAMIISELEEEIAARERARRSAQRAADAERSLDRLLSNRDLVEIEVAAQEKRFASAGVPSGERELLKEELRRRKRGLKELDRRIKRAEKRLEASWEQAEAFYNEQWGQIFKDRNTQSRFGAQVARFACIYTSRASNFFYYPVSKLFKPPKEPMPHELGD